MAAKPVAEPLQQGGTSVTAAKELLDRITANIELIMVGKRTEIQYVLVAMLAQGHVLIEDVPGVGKTTLVRALARSLGLQFRRIQFTPDLLPSDVTGTGVWNQARQDFEYRPGPVMAQVVLADEINRTSPKTQSALLECMEEAQVTVDGVSHPLPQPFLVLATQNPIEYEGTFALPEAQLDRFLLRMRIGYPGRREEKEIIRRALQPPLLNLEQVAAAADIIALQEQALRVHVENSVEDYLIDVVQRSRSHQAVYLGASPRATVALYRCAQALSLIRGRNFVTPDDVREIAPLCLGHRLILKPETQLSGTTPDEVIAEILAQTPVPLGVRRDAATS